MISIINLSQLKATVEKFLHRWCLFVKFKLIFITMRQKTHFPNWNFNAVDPLTNHLCLLCQLTPNFLERVDNSYVFCSIRYTVVHICSPHTTFYYLHKTSHLKWRSSFLFFQLGFWLTESVVMRASSHSSSFIHT